MPPVNFIEIELDPLLDAKRGRTWMRFDTFASFPSQRTSKGAMTGHFSVLDADQRKSP